MFYFGNCCASYVPGSGREAADHRGRQCPPHVVRLHRGARLVADCARILRESLTKHDNCKLLPNRMSKSLLLEVAIEAIEAREQEDGVVLLLLNARAPIPRARQAAVNARARINEIVGAAAVKAVAKEV